MTTQKLEQLRSLLTERLAELEEETAMARAAFNLSASIPNVVVTARYRLPKAKKTTAAAAPRKRTMSAEMREAQSRRMKRIWKKRKAANGHASA
jgi:hypothetical protein